MVFKEMSIRVTYNSPLILTYSLISAVVLLISIYITNLIPLLGLSGNFNWSSPMNYVNLFSYAIVHDNSSFSHFISNFTIILLIGPALEEKYGVKKLLVMMLVTAVITGLLNVLIFRGGIIGASGIALMMIILSSFTNYSKGDLPMTFIIICIFFMGTEVLSSFTDDNISQFAHIMGGISGALFGFYYKK